MTCSYRDSITQTSFTALRIICALPTHSYPQTLATTGHSFLFQECHIVGTIHYTAFSDWLLSFGNMHLSFIHASKTLATWCEGQLTGKDPGAGKVWGQEGKRVTEDEMVWWRHGLNGREFEQTLGDSEGQGSLVCCHPWGHKESDVTENLSAE